MAVPEPLRRLDEDLATGRVDAESYRRRRDELLAARLPPPPSATGDDLDDDEPAEELDDDLADDELDAAERELGVEPEVEPPSVSPRPLGIPVPATGGEAPPLPETRPQPPRLRPPPPPAEDVEPVDDPVRALPADPFPPPFRWAHGSGGAEAASPETTQVVRDVPAGRSAPPVDPADRTQVVRSTPSGGTADPSPCTDEPAAEATQVVPRRPEPPRARRPARPTGPAGRVGPPPSERTQLVPGAVPARSAGGGVAPPGETAPPWATAAARSEGLQGRELFVRTSSGPNLAAVAGTGAVLVLVVLVLVLSFLLA